MEHWHSFGETVSTSALFCPFLYFLTLFCSSPLITCTCLRTSSSWLLSRSWAFPAISTYHNLDFFVRLLAQHILHLWTPASHFTLYLSFPFQFSSPPRLCRLPSTHVFWLLRLQCSFSPRVPCTAKKRADTFIPWTLTRPVPSYLFFPVLLVFRPVPLLFASQASGAFSLPPRLLCYPQPTTKTSLHLSDSKANPARSHSPCSNSRPLHGSSSWVQTKQIRSLRNQSLLRIQDRKAPWFQLRHQWFSLQEASARRSC